jgi:hypothetical protein
MDFNLAMTSIPQWMLHYATAPTGCVQRFAATLKISSTQMKYKDFIGHLLTSISVMQSNSLEFVLLLF